MSLGRVVGVAAVTSVHSVPEQGWLCQRQPRPRSTEYRTVCLHNRAMAERRARRRVGDAHASPPAFAWRRRM